MPRILYQCTICDATFSDRPLAVNCEAQGKPKFKWRVGQKFTSKNHQAVVLEVLKRKVSRIKGKHVARYLLKSTWRRRVWFITEKSLERYQPID